MAVVMLLGMSYGLTSCNDDESNSSPSEVRPEVLVVFSFDRTRDFMDGFAESLSLADRVILLDIYPARELPIEGVTSAALLEKITSKEKLLCSKEELLNTIKRIDPQLIMTVGAGDIDRFVPQIEKLLGE